jgi:hypothetical protein
MVFYDAFFDDLSIAVERLVEHAIYILEIHV